MADEADGIEAAHVLLLQEIDRVAVALGEQRDQHIGAGHRVLAARLHMQDRTLDHALETRGRLRVGALVRLQRLVFLFEILLHHCGQLAEIDTAGRHDLRGVLVVDQREQEVLERRIFVPTLARIGQRGVKGLFEIGGKAGHSEVFRLGLAKGEHGTAYGPKVSQSCIGRRYGHAGR